MQLNILGIYILQAHCNRDPDPEFQLEHTTNSDKSGSGEGDEEELVESSVHHEEGGEWFRYGRGEAKKPRAKRNIKVVTRMNEEEEEGGEGAGFKV